MSVVAIDPGTEFSAWCRVVKGVPDGHGHVDNATILRMCRDGFAAIGGASNFAIELVRGYGMKIGNETLDTVLWSGRFVEALHQGALAHQVMGVARTTVKMHLTGGAKASDADIYEALRQRYGGPARALGVKGSPGPLYKMSSHARAALAVALVIHDESQREKWEIYRAM